MGGGLGEARQVAAVLVGGGSAKPQAGIDGVIVLIGA